MVSKVKNRKAFTLMEILISSVIATFISMVAIGALRSVAGARERVEQNIIVADELRFASDMIRSDLENVYRDEKKEDMKFIGTISESDDEPPVSMIMNIVSNTKARAGSIEGDVYEVQYFVVTEDEKSVLMRRYCPVIGIEDDELTTGGMLAPIAENIIGFDLMYFDGEEWLPEWPDEEEFLPGMVEVTLSAAAPDDADLKTLAVSNFIVNFPRCSNSVTPESLSGEEQPEEGQQPQQGQQMPNQAG